MARELGDGRTGAGPGDNPGLQRFIRITWWVLGASALGLVITGLPLIWTYRPVDGSWTSSGMRSVHGLSADLFLVAATIQVVLSLVARRAVPASGWRIGAAVGAILLGVLGGVTGNLLPWDQVGLWAVTVGSDFDGGVLFENLEVRSVFVGGAEISPGTYRTWVAIHLVVLPLVAAVGAGVAGYLGWVRPLRTTEAAARPSALDPAPTPSAPATAQAEPG